MFKSLKLQQIRTLFLVLSFLAFGLQLIASLSWEMVHDTPILVYSVYQFIEEGLIPYQDLFEYNLPGTYLFFSVWSRLFGYNDLSFRILDVIWLAALLFTIYLITKRFGKYAAWFSVVLLGLS